MISKLAMLAKKTIEAVWLNGPSYDLATQAAEALESAQLLMSPEKAAELGRLRARVAELETRPLAWAEGLDAKSLDNFLIALASAAEYEPMNGALARVDEIIRSFREAVDAPDGITKAIAPTQALREDEPVEDPCHPCGCPRRFDRHADGCPTTLRAEDARAILSLAPSQHADAQYNAAFQTIELELTATPEQWTVWQEALCIDLARTTHRGSFITSHATWRGIHVVIRCWPVGPDGGGE